MSREGGGIPWMNQSGYFRESEGASWRKQGSFVWGRGVCRGIGCPERSVGWKRRCRKDSVWDDAENRRRIHEGTNRKRLSVRISRAQRTGWSSRLVAWDQTAWILMLGSSVDQPLQSNENASPGPPPTPKRFPASSFLVCFPVMWLLKYVQWRSSCWPRPQVPAQLADILIKSDCLTYIKLPGFKTKMDS